MFSHHRLEGGSRIGTADLAYRREHSRATQVEHWHAPKARCLEYDARDAGCQASIHTRTIALALLLTIVTLPYTPEP